MVTTQKKQTGTTKAKQARGGKATGAGDTMKGPDGRRTVAEQENVEAGPAAEGAQKEREERGKSGAARIEVNPTTVGIGSPVKIYAPGTEGPITIRHPAQGQTIEPDLDRRGLATFQHLGEATFRARKAKGKGFVEATITVV